MIRLRVEMHADRVFLQLSPVVPRVSSRILLLPSKSYELVEEVAQRS